MHLRVTKLFLDHFFGFSNFKLNPYESRKSYLSRNAIRNFRSFPYLDFELSLPPVRKTGDFDIMSNRRFKNKTADKIAINYKYKSRN